MSENDLESLKDQWVASIASVADSAALETLRVDILGKKGALTQRMKALGALPAEERAAEGARLNAVKGGIDAALTAKAEVLAGKEMNARLERERVDVTLPARPRGEGCIHPISQTIEELTAIFAAMGFRVAKGPDIESDFYNFTAMNMPPDHPARQMQDTFYLPPRDEQPTVLRTHTSPVQARTMMTEKPPIRVIVPGRTYRCDYDITHTPMFHQIEGLVIDETAHMGHLKGCLTEALRAFFGVPDLPLRFRPSYFPFTEPSAEVDIGCSRKGGELRLGNYGDWLEIAGCGMVHPNVLKNCNVDAERWQGFAFGMGLERVAMLKYGIPDLRTFFDSDVRWLSHYGFLPFDVPNPAVTGGAA